MEKTILKIAQSISSTLRLDEVLHRILDESIKLVKAEAGSILLLNRETSELNFRVVRGEKSKKLRDFKVRFKSNEGIVGATVQTGKAIISNDVQKDERFKKDIDWLTGFTTKSLVAVPIIMKGVTFGVIELINKKCGNFSDNDIETISAIAVQSAAAIENARLYEEIYTTKKYLDNILESMPGGFITVNTEGKVMTINPRAAEILDVPQEIVGKKYAIVFIRFQEIIELFNVGLTKSEMQLRREMQFTVGNKRKVIGYSTLLIKDTSGMLKGVGMIFQDITAIKKRF
ncbi:MAG: GAF domain-containing protein [Elusimicrobia bacterium]|nr:GAF domain-containing protein [Elusimicrobiota bacterium]